MLAAASDVATMAAGRTRADLDSDMMLRRALIQAIQEIGEAAARMTDAGRDVAPTIPWTAIVGMRNIVVHVYRGIDLNRVWQVAVDDIAKPASPEPKRRSKMRARRGEVTGSESKLVPLVHAAIELLPLPPDLQTDC